MTAPRPPFPGAEHDPMLLIGYPLKDVTAQSYFTLLAKQAVTYATATPLAPVTLGPGDRLYRVYGGPAGEKGGFWAPAAPAGGTSEGAWRRTNAVEPSWNTGTHVVELTVNPGQSLQSWVGEIESQPALDNTGAVIDDWWLVGGGTQYFCQFWTPEFSNAVTLTAIGGTPWSGPRIETDAQDTSVAEIPVGELDAANPHHRHVSSVARLVQSLQGAAIGSEAQDRFDMAAATLGQRAHAMLAASGRDDAAALRIARSHLGLGRVLDLDPTAPQNAEILSALDAVLLSAAELSGRSS